MISVPVEGGSSRLSARLPNGMLRDTYGGAKRCWHCNFSPSKGDILIEAVTFVQRNNWLLLKIP